MNKKILLIVFVVVAMSCCLVGAQNASESEAATNTPASFIAPTPPASGNPTTIPGSASAFPAESESAPSQALTVNLTTIAPFTPSPSPLPGSATALFTPIVSSLAPTAMSRNPSASPNSESGASTGASNSESAASASGNVATASTGASNSESAVSASTGASNSGSAASASGSLPSTSTGASNSGSAASASTAATTGASNSESAASASGSLPSTSTGPSSTVSAASPSTGSAASATTIAASNSESAASASNSAAAQQSPSYNCYCDWYEIPTIQKVPDYNSSFDYSNYAPGTLFYGQQLSNTLNYMAVASTQSENGAGIVDVFTRFANFPYWTRRTTLMPTTTNQTHYFGSYVSILNDANVLVIETNPRPRFYSFERSAPASWIQIQPNFLLNVARVTAMDARGTLMVVAYRSGVGGALAIYNKIGYNWTFMTNFTNPEGGNVFYSAISIGAGNIFAAVTSNAQGSVHVFTKTNAGVWNAPQVVSSNASSGAAYFGVQLRTVSVSADRQTIAVGSTTTIWLMSAFGNRTFPAAINQITAYDTEANSAQFTNINNLKIQGNLMAVSDNQAAPASLSNTECTPSATTGAIFVFTRNGIQASAQTVFRPASQDDAFGNSLSLSTNQGNIIVAGGSVDTVYTFIEQGDVAIPQPCATYYG